MQRACTAFILSVPIILLVARGEMLQIYKKKFLNCVHYGTGN